MIKYFCDKCGKELNNFNDSNRFASDAFTVRVEPPEIRRWTADAETGTYILCYDCAKALNDWFRKR